MMCRGLLVLSTIVLVGLCLAHGSNIDKQLGQRDRTRNQQQSGEQQGQQAKPFRGGYEYTFTYNGQITTGLNQALESVGGDSNAQQKSATRIQCQCKIAFSSSRHATLRLGQIRVGHLNQRIAEPQQVQPMGMFEPKQIEQDKLRQLQRPCEFSYVDGVVERIEFDSEDSTWSKNIKRSVLNLIQLNLSKNNVQGLRVGEQLGSGQQEGGQPQLNGALGQQSEQQRQQQQSGQKTKTFTLPETTIEGEGCMTTYTINKAQNQREQKQRGRQDGGSSSSSQQQDDDQEDQDQKQQRDNEYSSSSSCQNCFNVTKSINFKQCKKIADVAYGFQTEQPQPQCAECPQHWAKQQQQNQQGQQQQSHPCDQCDPKEIKEQKLDRTTVLRFVLTGKPEKYAIKRSELISQYVYKNLKSETGKYGAAMQAVVSCELVFRGAQQKDGQQQNQQDQHRMKPSSEHDESLCYDHTWDVDEKRFYMYGDNEFQRRDAPFMKVQKKVEQAHNLILRLIDASSDRNGGIEADSVVLLQRLVELLRMCSVEELKKIQQLRAPQQSQQQGSNGNNDPQQQKVQQMLADTLAIAGTRNTIHVLVEKIINQQVSTAKAVQTLKQLSGLPAPSHSQVDEILRLCRNEIVHRNPALEQSCWLTFGSMVGELCQQKTQKNSQPSPFSVQSGFNHDEICPSHKKEIYKKNLFEKYNDASSTYEQVLALKCLGNAGLDIAVQDLEQLIRNKRISRVVRIQAIDALRRLRTQMPRKIQRALLPLFQNTREHPEVRMAAFSMIMHTQPEQQIVDQCAFTLTKEPSKQVQSFVYTLMKTLAKSHVPCKQQLAKHLKNALKLTNVDEQTLRSSQKHQVPIYSTEEKEGVFLNLASVFSARSMLPSHLSASLDTMLNDQFEINSAKVSFTQKEIDSLYEKLMQTIQQNSNQGQQYGSNPTRGRRASSSQRQSGNDELRSIFSQLGIKSRDQQQSSYENDQDQPRQRGRCQQGQAQGQQRCDSPFAMICVRIGDVDQVILPLGEEHAPAVIRQMLRGQKPSLNNIMEAVNGKQFRLLTAMNLIEKSAKIPTSMGVPLRILAAVPVLANIEAQVKINNGQQQDGSNGNALDIKLHPCVTVAHIQKMETWLPIIVTGVESVRAIEINTPIQARIQSAGQTETGIQVSLKVPQATKTRVFGLHSVPVTFIRDFNTETKMLKEPRVKTIHNEQLEQQERSVNKVVGEHTYGTPFLVKGHYHQPSHVSDYKQIVQLAMATENHVHVTFEPKEETPKEILLRLTGTAFKKIGSGQNNQNQNNGRSHLPQLKEFYSNSVKFEHAYPEDFEDMRGLQGQSLEDHSQRREKLQSFLEKFQPSQMYKHQLKLEAKTVGGRKACQAKMDVEGNCDSKFKYCKVFVDAERTPMYAEEQGKWNLKSDIQILCPDTVSSRQQLSQLSEKQQKFVCQAEAQWGCQGKKQMVNLRIQGENAKKPQWQQQDDQDQQERNQRNRNNNDQDDCRCDSNGNCKGNCNQESGDCNGIGNCNTRTYNMKRTPFLNKYDVVADYKLQPSMQNLARNCLEMLKAYNFWNTQSEDQQQQQQQNQLQLQGENRQSGKVYASVVIDPITQKHCNISVKTPSQLVRIQAVELPTQIRPFQLVRKQEQSTHSVPHLFSQALSSGRAECKVDGQRVNTFDDVLYKAPISNCYSVLAKDCSSEQSPKFAVLMKTQKKQGQNQNTNTQQEKSQQNKKIKVVTEEHTIECQCQQKQQQNQQQQQQRQQNQNQQQCKLQCKINGKPIKNQYDDDSQDSQQQNSAAGVVDYDNDDQTACTINAPGVQVRFNGKKAWIKISNLYKNSQCGLCGHYNDDSDSEWRMANNEQTDDLAAFHQSFTLKGGANQDDEECTDESREQFYNTQSAKFQMESQEFGRSQRNGIWGDDEGYYSSGSGIGSSQQKDQDEQDQDDQSWWGQQRKPSRRSGQRSGQRMGDWDQNDDQNNDQNTEEPVLKTKVIEYNHKICFSTKPVKQCPEGTTPAENYQRQQQMGDSNEQQQQQQKSKSIVKMPFTCLERSSVDARRLARQARRGVVVELGGENAPNFREDVHQPQRCVRY